MSSRVEVQWLALSILVATISTLPIFLSGAALFQIGPELWFVVALWLVAGTLLAACVAGHRRTEPLV